MTASILHFETSDPDHFGEHVSPLAPNIAISGLRKALFRAETDGVFLPGLSLARHRVNNFNVRSEPGRGFTSITIPLSRSFEIVEQNRADEFHSGSAHVLAENRPFDLRLKHGAVLVVNFDSTSLRELGYELQSLPGNRLPLTTSSGGAFWRQSSRLWSEIQQGLPIARSPLAIRETADSLASQFVLAATAIDSPVDKEPENTLTHADFARAEDWILAYLDQPISRADLCAASGLNARQLSRCFQSHYGMGPMTFVRQRRLDAVREILIAAEPGEVAVSEVALDYGFYHLSRFAADYRRAFGELPSQTLHI
jgi:AraC-like DNA-binding protein